MNAAQYMIVTENDGGKTSFVLSDNPIITHNNGNVKISTSKTTVEFAISDVKNFTFSNFISSVDLNTSQADGNEMVEVYKENGEKVASLKKGSISLSEFPKGIYILKTSSNTYKVLNK